MPSPWMLTAALSTPPCLPSPSWSDALDDHAIVESMGVRPQGAADVLRDARLDRCLPPGRPAIGTLQVSVAVACDGRVSHASVFHPTGTLAELSPTITACAERVIAGLRFPSHALPDGVDIDWRAELDFPTGP